MTARGHILCRCAVIYKTAFFPDNPKAGADRLRIGAFPPTGVETAGQPVDPPLAKTKLSGRKTFPAATDTDAQHVLVAPEQTNVADPYHHPSTYLRAAGVRGGQRHEHLAVGVQVVGEGAGGFVGFEGDRDGHRSPVVAHRCQVPDGVGFVAAVVDANRPRAAGAHCGHQRGYLDGDALRGFSGAMVSRGVWVVWRQWKVGRGRL